MSDRRGYLKISRKFYQDDPWWTEPRRFSRAEAWLDFLYLATFRARVHMTTDGPIPLDRGQLVASYRYLASRWRWSVKQVRTWIETCQKWARIRAQRETHAGTVYVIVNYDFYQTGGTEVGTDTGTVEAIDGAQQGHSKGTRKKQVSNKADTTTPSEVFAEAWATYPRRPNNNRARAWRAWVARLAEGEAEAAMLAGTSAYAAFVKREGTEPRFVKLASTFYGPDRPYADEYAAPAAQLVQVYDPVTGDITPEAARLLGVA